ncbi:hypothetical protein GOP47_0017090 [Adiantum capillus-veneris]|uniref:Transcription repressor n=1 Tax=Adiantum capillus-veneris TaxID=13818 RepID=A0A9D4UJ12_ADICA|nr:hypothetical protein GOP47_0017090 [Adiantum capillus-veneris]
MGKLLQKLVNGIAPSWFTKVKSSAGSSPKKLALPFFGDGGSNTPNNKSAPPSPTTPPPPPAVPALIVEKSTTISRSSSSMQQNESDAANTDSLHPHEESHHSEDVSKQDISRSLSSMQRKESDAANGDSIHAHEESHLSEDVKKHYKPHSFQYMILLEDEISQQSQSGCGNSNIASEPHGQAMVEKQKVIQLHMQGDNYHDGQDGGQEAKCDSGYHENAYQDILLGLKRKSRSLQSEDGEDDVEEEEDIDWGGGDINRWAWKRWKGEKGMMSCELPEGICSIVGNGRAVVKQSLEPHFTLWESMVEMIVGNGLWELGNLEFLLYCYLSLNEPHLHPIIQSSFLRVLKDLERIS